MRRQVLALLLLSLTLSGGCIDTQEAQSGSIRVLHAAVDAPRLNLMLNGQLRVSQFDYGAATPYIVGGAGEYQVKIDQVLPEGATDNVIDEPMQVGVNEELSLIVVGQSAVGTVEVVPIRTSTRGVPTSRTRVQFVHAAAGGQAVDVYVTAPDAVITASAPFATGMPFKGFSAQQDIASGTVKVVLTVTGNPASVLFDSGSVSLPLEGTLLIAAVPNPGLDAATVPFSLVLVAGSGSAALFDKNEQANLRVVNASPDSYPLDVLFNDPSDDMTILQRTDLQFGEVDGYFTLAPDTYDVKVQRTGDAATVPLEFSTAFAGASESTLVLTDLIAELVRLVLFDNNRRVATEARLRLVHASPGSGTVDIYIADPGAVLTSETPDFQNAVFGTSTSYIPLLAETQQVTFIVADSTSGTDIRLTQQVNLQNGGIYTLMLTDGPGGGLPAQALSLDDPF